MQQQKKCNLRRLRTEEISVKVKSKRHKYNTDEASPPSTHSTQLCPPASSTDEFSPHQADTERINRLDLKRQKRATQMPLDYHQLDVGRGPFQYALQQLWWKLDIAAGEAIPWHEQVLALCAEYNRDPASVTHYV